MAHYHKLGKIPQKRHIVFRQENGELYQEHVMGSRGFTGPASILYHQSRPTAVLSTKVFCECILEEDPNPALRMRHFQLHETPTVECAVLDRTPILFNNDTVLSIVKPSKSSTIYYRNAQADEVVFVTEGEGVLESTFGELPYKAGDYLVIPTGILHRFRLESDSTCFFVIEGRGEIRPPRKYLSSVGQFLEHSPYCERDLRIPESLPLHDEKGEFRQLIKQNGRLNEVVLDHHPFDVIGWDGYYYPWALSIHDFEPIVGSIHQPPPVHQTFQADGFVVCSFVPRLFDFHPEAIPAPYNHSNVNSDEVLYYANDEFMSRKGIAYGSLTLHPDGIPHGPQPGKAEASIGKKRTEELAVMIDTFRPLKIAKAILSVEEESYGRSWLEGTSR